MRRDDQGSTGGELKMPRVALVRCDGVEQVLEDGDPCTVLCARLVVPANAAHPDSEEGGYEAVVWVNQEEAALPRLPRAGATVCLIPYPHGTVPSLIVGDCRIFYVWAGPVFFGFCLYDPQLDVSGFLGKVFVVREI